MKKFLIIISVLALSVFAFFFSNIKGYYQFKQYCEAEGGLKVYESLERNVGWLAEGKGLAINAAMLPGVGFSRYKDDKNLISYDVRFIGGDVRNSSSYKFTESGSDNVVYKLTDSTEYLDDDKRLKRVRYVISDLVSAEVAEFNDFYFSAWGGNLGGPDWVSCSSESMSNDWKVSLEKAFK